MQRRNVEWLLFILLLALGAAGGLAWAWLAAPARPGDATPAALNPIDRAIYLHLVADSFAADGNQGRAAARLDAWGPDARTHLVTLLAEELRGERGGRDILRLAGLAAALEIDAPEVALLAPLLPLPGATPVTRISSPQATSSPATAAGRYELIDRASLCVAGEAARHIEIRVGDGDGTPMPGIPITVAWDGGHDTFFTGFAGAGDRGRADFAMSAGVNYSVAVGNDAPAAANLAIQVCPDGQDGGWQLTFRERTP